MMTTAELKEIAALIDEIIAAGQLPYLAQSVLMTLGLGIAALAVFFILQAIGLYTINRRLGKKGGVLAFIPGFSGYVLGSVADGLKKRKPSNYCIHMLMIGLFSSVVSLVYYIYLGGRFLWLYEALATGHPLGTYELLEATFIIEREDTVLFLAYYVMNFVGYAVTFVSFLCHLRILQLFRSRSGFFLLIASAVVPQVMSVYLFAARNRALYPDPPVFRMPDMNGSFPEDGGYSSGEDTEEPYDGGEPSDGAPADGDDTTENGDPGETKPHDGGEPRD